MSRKVCGRGLVVFQAVGLPSVWFHCVGVYKMTGAGVSRSPDLVMMGRARISRCSFCVKCPAVAQGKYFQHTSKAPLTLEANSKRIDIEPINLGANLRDEFLRVYSPMHRGEFPNLMNFPIAFSPVPRVLQPGDDASVHVQLHNMG